MPIGLITTLSTLTIYASRLSENHTKNPVELELPAMVAQDLGVLADNAYQNQKQSLFFTRLSPEIRIMIFENLLVSKGIIARTDGPRRYPKEDGISMIVPIKSLNTMLLHTCRAAIYEGYPILYGSNTFGFDSPSDMNNFKLGGLETDFGRFAHSLLKSQALDCERL